MPIAVKVSQGNKVREPGYYPSRFDGVQVKASKTEDGPDMVEVALTVDYDGEELEYTDKCYASISATSKLALLAVALGFYANVDECVDDCGNTGELPELNDKAGAMVRAHFDKRASKDGRSYVALVGYEPPRQQRNRPEFGSTNGRPKPNFEGDIPF